MNIDQNILSSFHHQPDWLQVLREKQFQHFNAAGLPTRRDEAWKYTDLTALQQASYQLPISADTAVGNIVTQRRLAGDHYLAVFVNGHFTRSLSALQDLPQGVIVNSLLQCLTTHQALLQPLLEAEPQQFASLNAALMTDGLLVHIPQKIMLPKPLQIMHIVTGDGLMLHPRHVLIMQKNARATVVESYFGETNDDYLTNSVSQLQLGQAAKLDYYKILDESSRAKHIATTNIAQLKDSQLRHYSFSLNAGLARDNLTIELQQPGAQCELYGLYLPAAEQHMDHHTCINHVAGNTSSSELYKGIIADSGCAVFDGKIIVHKDAQQCRAKQINQNILLADKAVVNTKPQLEIYADDVQCSHGATIGGLDIESLFYLRARGLSESAARRILQQAFAAEVVNKIPCGTVGKTIKNKLGNCYESFSD